jgi:hypothetical protein
MFLTTESEINNPARKKAASLIQVTPKRKAARDAVLSRTATTGESTGRGSRRPKVKIEGDDGVTVEMAAAADFKDDSTPERSKIEGSRLRSSRADALSRLGITKAVIVDAATYTPKGKDQGGQPRGSKTVNRG